MLWSKFLTAVFSLVNRCCPSNGIASLKNTKTEYIQKELDPFTSLHIFLCKNRHTAKNSLARFKWVLTHISPDKVAGRAYQASEECNYTSKILTEPPIITTHPQKPSELPPCFWHREVQNSLDLFSQIGDNSFTELTFGQIQSQESTLQTTEYFSQSFYMLKPGGRIAHNVI